MTGGNGVSGIRRRYVNRTARSLALWREFSDLLVDGNTRSLAFYEPHPLVIVSGRGAVVSDADDNTYFDLLNNYTALVHGNAHPALMEAAAAVMGTGTVFPAPHALQARHAAMLRERIAGTEVVRYTNSGTKAAMLAVRVARAATGRDIVAKARFGYHGGFLPDAVMAADDRLELLRRTSAAVVERAGAGGRLLLVVDDAHLLDDGSAALVHQLVQGGLCSLVASVRTPTEMPDSVIAPWKDGLAERLDLEPLSEAEVERFAVLVLAGPVAGSVVVDSGRRAGETRCISESCCGVPSNLGPWPMMAGSGCCAFRSSPRTVWWSS
jgi:hypothetical protein